MTPLASLTNLLSGGDLLIILFLVLILFGAKKLPELAKGMGQAIREFQKAKDEFTDELHKAGTDVAQNPQPAKGTVPQIENSLAATPANSNQPASSGDKAEQV